MGIVLESVELESWNEVEWYGIEMEWHNLLNYCELNPSGKELNWNVT